MNDKPTPPHVFANYVLKQMIEHALSDDVIVEYEDYQALRVAFRHCGGTWVEIANGNITHIGLLSKIISAWGNMPGRKHKKDRVI